MPGYLGVSTDASYMLNRLDVIGCSVTVMRLGWLYWKKHGLSVLPVLQNPFKVLCILIPIVFGQISEYDQMNAKLTNRYLFCHSVWHLSVFLSMAFFLNHFIY